MSEWSAGYMADIDYTYGYYAELNPLRARLALMQAGLQAPAMEHACELGFGQGVTVNLHAAASATRWTGTDFNPAHASYAQELAQHVGQGTQLQEQAFDAFCQRTDLPDFDFIGMHGIWSWVSDENRTILVDFLARKLKPGGVLYVSYNTRPGWAAMAPMRDLLAEHARVMSAPSAGVIRKVDDALDFAQRLMATDPVYALVNPQIKDRLTKLQGQERHYLAHEYFNDHWHPMGFSEVARLLAPAKLQWACSADLADSMDSINVTAEQRELLESIPDRVFRESVRDFCINQQFRKDYWVKGARELSALEQLTQWREQRFVLIVPPAQVSMKITGRQAQITYSPAVYGPVLAALADHKPQTGAQLEQAVQAQGVDLSTLRQVLLALCSVGVVQPAQDETEIAKAQLCASALNSKLLEKSYGANPLHNLASPVTGGALGVTPFEQHFLLARHLGMDDPAQWGAYAWDILQTQGKYLAVNGQAVTDPEAGLAALQAQALAFAEQRLPILQSLGVA